MQNKSDNQDQNKKPPIDDDMIDSLTIGQESDKNLGEDKSDDVFEDDDSDLEKQDLSEVRVANLRDDAETIESEPFDIEALDDNEFYEDEEGNFIKADSGEAISNSEALNVILRRHATQSLEFKAARKRTIFLMIIIIILTALLITLVFVIKSFPKTVYIPTKDNEAICEVTPENNPYLNDVAIAEFGRDGILSLYSVNFTNWQKETDRIFSEYFTSDGKARAIAALRSSDMITYIDKNALSLRASSTSASHVESKGVFPNGQQFWMISFPFVVEVYSGREKKPIQVKHYVATVRVVADRASSVNPRGLGIDSINLFERK